MRKHTRILAAAMTIVEAIVIISLTGCSGKKIDYGNESESKETKNMSALADIRADSGWNENFTIQTGNGEKTVYVNANIVVPDFDNMSVVEVENVKIDADYKKRFLDLYFGGNEYYYHDPDHYTVDELNEVIEDWQKTQDETHSEWLEQQLAEYRDKLETAKTTYTVAKDLENCEVFAGYKGDVFCEVDFEAHKVHAYALHQSGTDYGPPSLRNEDYDTITQTFQDDDLKDKADETSNEGSKSAASAKKEAGDFLSKLGMQDLVERGECECSWIGFNNSEEGNDYQTAVWGYIYSYATGIDGITFKDGFDAGWKKIVIDGIDIIEHIARYNIKENKYACILSYVICDHLLSVLYLAMYCAEEDVLDRERNVISSYRHIENSVCILNKILFSVFDNKIEYSNLDSLVKELKSISFEDMDIIRENEKFLLELDNYNTIYEAVYNIIDNLKVKAQKIDKVIYFAYGGISLGYAFKTIMKELFDKNVELLPSHYSSKRNNTESGIIDRIPRFKCGENGWMDESTVLLLDNNVTTFKTLSTSKSYLQKRGNKVYCAVAEVDYKNIYKWLLGKGEYEEMCHNWFDVIDAKPIMNYFSAYNTWGTSETSALLEQLYSQDFIFQNTDNLIPRKIHSEHRKICRIHNVYDLRLAMEMGATMIGIHAVISCKDKYYKIEDYHGIKVEYYPNLPVPDYEIESIRYMVRCLPDGVMPILIIENKLSVEDIMKVINIYGLNVFKCGIQMQFRTNIEYINKIIEMGFERVIVAVGLMQKDVKEYLEFVDKALRTSKDLILLDMSRHQPHVIVNEKVIDKYDVSFETKYNCLNRIVSCLKKLETSVLLADDIMPDKMILCQLMLLSQGVNIIGLDMQNNIEVDKTEQKYCKIKENKTSKYHYAKIRKSVEKIKKWNIFE